jgi:hypothetical protein
VLRNKRYIEGLHLDCLPPESELVHSTWESELMNMAQLLAVDIPVALQQARVLVELRTAPNSALCEHGAPLLHIWNCKTFWLPTLCRRDGASVLSVGHGLGAQRVCPVQHYTVSRNKVCAWIAGIVCRRNSMSQCSWLLSAI